MKLLFVVPYVPTLIRVRSYQLLRSLARRGHAITLATVWTCAEEQADLQALRDLGLRIVAQPMPTWRSLGNSLLTLPTALPLQSAYSWHSGLANQLARLIHYEHFDALHVEHLRGSRYGLFLRQVAQRQQIKLPIIWDSVDCISHLFRQAAANSLSLKSRIITNLELKRTAQLEARLVKHFDQVLVTSPTDKASLDALTFGAGTPTGSAPSNVHVLANGVDMEHFAPNGVTRAPARLVYSGKMSYHANVTAALHLVQEIMPLVWAQRPEVEVMLVGKDPTPAIRALDSSSTRTRRVTVTGTVAALPPYLQEATLAVAPVPYGAGIQNKVLEAMACATPVVASPQASSALRTIAGRDLLVADNPQAFATTILQLLADANRCAAVGAAGRHYVEQHHSWDAAAQQLEQLYQLA